MATGTSLFLIALGAVLAMAVNVTVTGIDINAVGVILMVVGLFGLLYSLLFLASFAPFSHRDSRETYIERDHTHGHY
jgi:hypothetical protein